MSAQVSTPEEVQQTLQSYLAQVTATGDLRGHRAEVTADGVTWSEVIFDEAVRPIAARATVYRAGWEIPTVVTELWGETVPADDAWRARWEAHPNALSKAHVMRTALRRTFADVLGDRREPDDVVAPVPAATVEAPAPEGAPDLDWYGRVEGAKTLADLNDVRRAARGARAMDLQLKAAIEKRRAELEDGLAVERAEAIASVEAAWATGGDPELVEKAADEPAPKKPRRARRAPKPEKTRTHAPDTSVAAAMREALAKHDEAER